MIPKWTTFHKNIKSHDLEVIGIVYVSATRQMFLLQLVCHDYPDFLFAPIVGVTNTKVADLKITLFL